ncbi:aspartyl protease family protein [Altericista sp. CCNU0014]|uniref:aspartyl protease family protein n=1 Tax=Altericista sp. CCNU0014 TaxID=3082949 RepID=UPI00384E21D0
MKLQAFLFLMLVAGSLGLGFSIRDRLNQKTHAHLVLAGDTVALPFEDYGGHIYVQGKIDGVPTKDLILDSGAADLFISESKAKALQLQPQGKAMIPGRTETIATVKVSNLALQLGPLILNDRTSVVIPQAETLGLEQYFGRRISGIVGYELFEQLVVELDYSRRTLRLFRPKTYRYRGNGQRIPMTVTGDRPYIDATIVPHGYPALPGKLMIDLGSNAALSLTAACGLDRRLIAAAPRTLKRNLATIQGSDEIVMGRLRRVQIGPLQIDRPTAIFGATRTGECDRLTGKIGYQVLRQFKVILDYPHRQLILEPNTGNPPPPDNHDLSGLWLKATGPQLKDYRVGAVSPDTPAFSAGVRVGDRVVRVNNIETSELTLVQIRQQLSQAGQTASLVLQRKTERIPVRLRLQPSI